MRTEATHSTELLLTSGELRVAIGRIARRMKQLYEAGEVTFSETSVLSRLDRGGPATPGALAAAEHVRPQAIVTIVNALELRGLVARSPDPADGRKVLIALTDAGRQAFADKGRAVSQRMAQALAEGFSPAEQRQLREVLPLLERLAGML
jgi:DNA-binding MarR family transcriptional regulator